MPEKREPPEGASGAVPQNSRDKAKAVLPESQSPAVDRAHPLRQRLKRNAPKGFFAYSRNNHHSRYLASREEIHNAACLGCGQGPDDGIDVQGIRGFQELESALEIDVLPGDGAELLGRLRALRVPGSFLVLQEAGEDRGVEKMMQLAMRRLHSAQSSCSHSCLKRSLPKPA
jgi:hypothetical protein